MPGNTFTFQLSDDPNEPDEEQTRQKKLHDKHTIECLDLLLREKPDEYKECTLKRTDWSHGEAAIMDSTDVIHIPSKKSLGRGFDGDIVLVKICNYSRTENGEIITYGKVEGVLERNYNIYSKQFICRVDDNNCSQMVPINDDNIKFFIKSPHFKFRANKIWTYQRELESGNTVVLQEKRWEVVNPNANHREEGNLYVVRYIAWSMYHLYPFGYVERIYRATMLQTIKLKYDVPDSHSVKARDEAMADIEQELHNTRKRREDLTELVIFTIDEESTQFHEDALSVEKCEEHINCWKIGAHITDVCSFVPEGGTVDIDAKLRITSFYNNKGTNTTDYSGRLLPNEINDACNLTCDKDEEKFAVSTFFHSSDPPHVYYDTRKSEKKSPRKLAAPFLSKVKIKYNLTYKCAQQHLQGGKCNACTSRNRHKGLSEKLDILWRTMWKFRLHRLDCGAFYGNIANNNHDVEAFQNECMTRIIVEETMITLNASTALFLKEKQVRFKARAQPLPLMQDYKLWNPSTLSAFQASCIQYMQQHNLILRYQDDPDTKMLLSSTIWDKISEALEDRLEEAIFLACCDDDQPEFVAGVEQYFSMQSKHKIIRNPFNCSDTSHHHLRVNIYAHFSSPLRRYIDLDNQRKLVKFLQTRRPMNYLWPNPLEISAADCTGSDEIIQKEASALCYRQEVDHFRYCNDFTPKYFEGFITKAKGFAKGIVVRFPLLAVSSLSLTSIPMSELAPTSCTTETNSYEWLLRYYNVQEANDELVQRDDGVIDHIRKRSTVDTTVWNQFYQSLSNAATSQEFTFEENSEIRDDIAESLRSVIENINEETIRWEDQRKLTHQTVNGIFHGRKFKIDASTDSRSPIYVQFCVGLNNTIPNLYPQLLRLEPDLDICLSHRRHVTMFDLDYRGEDRKLLDDLNTDARTQQLRKFYYEKWIALVRMDAVYCSVHSNNSVILQSVSGVKITPSEDTYVGRFSLNNDFCGDRFLLLRRGDFLCIRARKTFPDKYTWVAHGVISNVQAKATTSVITFKTSKSIETFGSPPNNVDLTCEIISLNVSHRRMSAALASLKDENSLVDKICFGNINCKPYRYDYDIENLDIGEDFVGNFSKRLNRKQIAQIKKALVNDVSLIQGPPGTGKSFMGAHLAYYFHKLNKDNSKEGKILYCGPSNKSVDVVASYLKLVVDLKVVRIYGKALEEMDFPIPIKPTMNKQNSSPPNPDLQSVALHHLIRQPRKKFAEDIALFDRRCKAKDSTLTTKDYQNYIDLTTEAKEHELQNVDVILCTCITAGSQLFSKIKFAQCIIDECGMCSEPESLVPITTAAKNPEGIQVTLIGDHKQLEAIVTCKAAYRAGLKTSMFERLQKQAEKLTKQYRMHETICNFPSKEFYDGDLETDESVMRRSPGILRFPQNKINNTAIFCDVSGNEEEDETKSKFNMDEVEMVIKLLQYLLIKCKILPHNIMVLSPYLAQCRKIKELISETRNLSKFKQLHVGSVVTSQGSEADYVIVSTVRSIQSSWVLEDHVEADQGWLYKYIGFVTDDHQINVAITRAKLGLCIIGNKSLLSKHETWRNLLSEYRKRGAVFQYSDVMHQWRVETPARIIRASVYDFDFSDYTFDDYLPTFSSSFQHLGRQTMNQDVCNLDYYDDSSETGLTTSEDDLELEKSRFDNVDVEWNEEQTTPNDDHNFANIQDDFPNTKDHVQNFPNIQDDDHNFPNIQDDFPNTKDHVQNFPNIQDDFHNFPNIQDDFPNIQDDDHNFPNIQDDFPNIQDDVQNFPNIQDDFPNIQNDFPNIQDNFPNIQDDFQNFSNIQDEFIDNPEVVDNSQEQSESQENQIPVEILFVIFYSFLYLRLFCGF